ncbi:hypothetical protein ACLM5H_02140 [Fredinandcohnia humi]
MDKLLLRGIAIGIIISTLVFSYLYFIENEEIAITEEQIENYLNEEGYVKVRSEEYNKLLQKSVSPTSDNAGKGEKDKEEQTVPTEPPSDEAKKAEPDQKTYTLSIEPGMSSDEIAETLEQAGIIPNSVEFNNFLIENGLNTGIQIGTYEVTTKMSQAEIANLISN